MSITLTTAESSKYQPAHSRPLFNMALSSVKQIQARECGVSLKLRRKYFGAERHCILFGKHELRLPGRSKQY